MLNPSVFRMALAVLAAALGLPTAAFAADSWAIAPGQEAVIEHALTTNSSWPTGWTFTGANIDHGFIDARYRNPAGVGLGVRLQHPQDPQGPRAAGPFEIANISADLPDDALQALKAQLTQVHDFKWTQLRDHDGENHDVLPGDPTRAQGGPLAPGVTPTADPCLNAPNPAECRQLQEAGSTASRWLPGVILAALAALAFWFLRRRK